MTTLSAERSGITGSVVRSVTVIFLLLALSVCTWGQSIHPLSSESTVTIASFNLRVFGVAKASKPAVMTILAQIIDRYDLVAVQEIRDKSGTAIQKLLTMVDAENSNYRLILGERLGRTSSKEQYAYFYNSSKLELEGSPYTYDDDNDGSTVNKVDDTGLNDLFEREPYLAHFKTTQGAFDFVIADLHTKPSDATKEISYLPMVMTDAAKHYGEKDVLVVGDFNADGSYFKESTYQSDFPAGNFIWLIGNSVDTNVARSDRTYDRMVGSESMAEDFEGLSGTLRFDQMFDLRAMGLKALDISDHYPVWAEFYVDNDTD